MRRIRKMRGLGQKPLAEKSGVAQPTISGIETGAREPHASTLRKLAEAMDVEVGDFFAEEERPPKAPPAPPTPFTDLSAAAFEELRAELRTEEAKRDLLEETEREFEDLRRWCRELNEYGTLPADLLAARKKRNEAGKRFQAAAVDWSESVIALDPAREGLERASIRGLSAEEIQKRVAEERRWLLALRRGEAQQRRLFNNGIRAS